MSSRRSLLGLGLRGLLGTALAACRPGRRSDADSAGPPPDSGPACPPVDPGTEAEGWITVALADHPALAVVGGQAAVDVDEAFLHLLVVRTGEDCWVGLWRYCSHGACEVAWDLDQGAACCPCHGSCFGGDGAVLAGPATAPLAAWEVARVGDLLALRRVD